MSEKNVIKHWRIQDLFKKVLKSRQLKYPMKIERILVHVIGAPDPSPKENTSRVTNHRRRFRHLHRRS